MSEIWKDIAGYEGLYQVSNLGRVRRKNKDKRCSEYRYLKPNCNNNAGYFKIALTVNGKAKHFLLHRLIAEAFIENPLNKPCVNHIDGNKKNLSLDNLEWTTHKENTVHAFSNGLCDGMINKLSKEIIQYDLDGNLIKTWNSFHEIERNLHVSGSLICKQIKHRTGYAYGFKWGYANEQL